MNVNCLYQLGRSRLSVELLTTICATTGANLFSLLEGQIEYVYAPSDLIPRARRRTARDTELMLSLRHAVEQTPGASVCTIARSLGVTQATLVAKFPELTAMIDKQVKKLSLEKETIERRVRRQRAVQLLHEVKKGVEASGGGFRWPLY
ncbi:hypothetical protein SAMN05414139_05681 [Burkholderia sp. D7]|nr:hypothetical protein SAMN05414139_05681 [Burkholderia sp. D7]